MASAILLAFGYDDFFVNAGGDIYAHGLNGS
jgi:thiamine biosynthesis lipoprotein ApbE